MKKILFCNIPVRKDLYKRVYDYDDSSISISDRAVVYPINAFLEKNLSENEELKIVLLVKKNDYSYYQQNVEVFKQEFSAISQGKNIRVSFSTIETDYFETKITHDTLLMGIIDEFEQNAHIIADITYGPKDLPIVLFTALHFAEKFLQCDIDNIFYGRADFVNKKPVNTQLCDMTPLYYINSLTHTLECSSVDEAKTLLKSLLSV